MNVDAFELNKIAGAVLLALLIFFGARTVSEIVLRAPIPEVPGYDVAVTDPAPVAEEEEEAVPLAVLLQEGSAGRGGNQAKKCVACHTFESGGPHRIGPNLYNVLGRDIAGADGYAYSPALQGMDGDWDYEAMDHFIANPRDFAPGTKMVFAGIRNAQQRADLMLYLREQSDSPLALPEAPEAAPAEAPEAEQAPAAEAAPAPTPPADAAPAEPSEADAPQQAPTPGEATQTPQQAPAGQAPAQQETPQQDQGASEPAAPQQEGQASEPVRPQPAPQGAY